MMDDGWEPIAQEDGWEPVTAPPLAQLSPGNYQPIGDAPPDFGEAKVQPGEVSRGMASAADSLGDVAANLLSNVVPVAPLLAGLKAAPALLNPFTDDPIGDFAAIAGPAAEEYQKKIYTPHTKAGEQAGEILGLPAKAGKYLGEHAQDLGLPPSIAAALDVGTQILPFALGDKAIRGRGEVAPKVPEIAPDVTEAVKPVSEMDTAQANAIPLAADNLSRLKELDKKRGNLTPDETAEHAELQYLDRRQGKVLGSGEPIEGVGNASALHENHDVENSPQVHTDIDNFKETNDQKGHPAGDVLIKHVGESLAAEFPPDEHGTPQVYHHGGDEFTIVPRDGQTLAEVHKRVQDVQEQVRNTPIELTDTAGVTSTHPGVDFSVGSGDTHAAAHESITRDKLDREAKGIRRPRNNRSTDQPGAEQGAADRGVASAERPQEQVSAGTQETKAPALVSEDAAPAPTGRDGSGGSGDTGRDSRVANAATYVDRATRGVEQLPEAEHKSWAESKSQAAEKIAADPEYAKNLASEVVANPRAISDVETMALGAERQKLQDAYHQAHDDILKARESADPVSEAQALAKRTDVENQLDLNERATKHAGTDLGRAMAARNALHAEDYTPARNITRAKVAFGDKFNEGIRKQVEDLSTRLASAEAQLARQEANKPAPSMKVSRAEKLSPDERMQAQIEKKMASLQEAIERRTKACPL